MRTRACDKDLRLRALSADVGTARTGGRAASIIDNLYRRHASDLVRYLRRRFGNGPPDPEDVAQATFAKLMTFPDLAELTNARAYIYTIACNTAIDQQRKMSRSTVVHQDIAGRELAEPPLALSSERILLSRERLAILEGATQAMPTMRRRIFLLVRVEGSSPRDVARQFGISEGAVHKHVSRALQDCAAMLEQAEGRAGA